MTEESCLLPLSTQWANGTCYNSYYRRIYSLPGNKLNPEALNEVRIELAQLFSAYLQNYSLTSPGRPGYNAFQETLEKTCQSLPGACDQALNKVCQAYRREQIADNPTLLSFCGCYAPELQGEVRRFLLNSNFIYDRACDPLCSRGDTIKLLNSKTGAAQQCQRDICVFSNININSQNSGLPLISFTQQCNCRQNCLCVFDSANTAKTIAALGLNYSLNSFCSQSSICLEPTSQGSSEVVPCLTTSQVKLPLPKSFYFILVGLVIVLILFALLYRLVIS